MANAVGQSPGVLKTGKRLEKMVAACGDAVGLVPLARWDLERLVNDPVTQHTFYQRGFKEGGFNESQTLSVQYGGFLGAVELWDCKFFGVASAEAACMDPQQRLLLEMGYAALHGASKRRTNCMQTDAGVFVGIERPDWPFIKDRVPEITKAAYGMGDPPCVASGRISFTLGFHGPCSSIDAACASALTAVHGAHACVDGGRVEHGPRREREPQAAAPLLRSA